MILRHLFSDHPEYSEKARKTIAEGAYTLPEVIAEVVYVLKGVYKVERSEIMSAIVDFMDEVAVDNQEIIVTKNGCEVRRFISKNTAVSYLTDSLTGILKEDKDLDKIRKADRKVCVNNGELGFFRKYPFSLLNIQICVVRYR